MQMPQGCMVGVQIQSEWDCLVKWAPPNNLLFNIANCNVLHLGTKQAILTGQGALFPECSDSDMDLGVMVTN